MLGVSSVFASAFNQSKLQLQEEHESKYKSLRSMLGLKSNKILHSKVIKLHKKYKLAS